MKVVNPERAVAMTFGSNEKMSVCDSLQMEEASCLANDGPIPSVRVKIVHRLRRSAGQAHSEQARQYWGNHAKPCCESGIEVSCVSRRSTGQDWDEKIRRVHVWLFPGFSQCLRLRRVRLLSNICDQHRVNRGRRLVRSPLSFRVGVRVSGCALSTSTSTIKARTIAVAWDGRLIFHRLNRANRPQVHGLVSRPSRSTCQPFSRFLRRVHNAKDKYLRVCKVVEHYVGKAFYRPVTNAVVNRSSSLRICDQTIHRDLDARNKICAQRCLSVVIPFSGVKCI